MAFVKIEVLKGTLDTRTILVNTDNIGSVYVKHATGPNGGVTFGVIVITIVGGPSFEIKYGSPDEAFPHYQMLEKCLREGSNAQV
jgi:hypothetical protein